MSSKRWIARLSESLDCMASKITSGCRFAMSFALVCSLVARPTITSAADAPVKKPVSSLDEELLKDLGGDSTEQKKPALPKPPEASKSPAKRDEPADKTKPDAPHAPDGQVPAAKKPATKKPAGNPLDEELLKGLGDDAPASKPADGQDSPADENPLVRLNRQMREVEELIRRARADTATQEKQAEIVQELEKLIKQLEQQAQQSSSSKSSRPQPKPQGSERSQAKPSGQSKPNPGSSSKPSDRPASDSSADLKRREDRKPDAARMQELLKDVWGELPPRLRQQMMQSSVEKFLPKYELLIEDYFKALSEKQRSENDGK